MKVFRSGFRAPAVLVLFASLSLAAPVARAQNVALGKSAFQSSTWASINGAEKAVDGDTQGSYWSANSVTHTGYEFNAWWYVDLGSTFAVNDITLWNRTDCCSERLRDFYVSVLAAGTSDVGLSTAPTVWTQLFSGPAGVTTTFNAGGAMGQYVKVQYNQRADYLQLAEVEVTAVNQVVPEPASLALFASGLLAVGGVAARRSKKS